MNKLPRNVWLLASAQALMNATASLVVFAGGLVGARLAPVKDLATLPVACMVIGTTLSTIPVSMLMKKLGRRRVFLIVPLVSILTAFLAAYAISIHAFYLLCTATLLLGLTTACVMQFRFAAMESVPEGMVPKAASGVLLGGIAAAFIGPEVALRGKDLLSVEFAGSFVLLAGLYFIAWLILRGFINPVVEETKTEISQRPLKTIAAQFVFRVALLSATIGYAVMSFIMTATPVSMHMMDGHSLEDTKWVIQSHILAMYVPSIFAAWVIGRLGLTRMMLAGLIAYLACIAIAYAGHHLGNYWISLILLGIGWNFLFIGGTTLLPRSYHAAERFKVQALNEFIVFGTQTATALSAGWIVFAIGWEAMLLLTIPVILLQILVVVMWGIRERTSRTTGAASMP